MGTRPVTGTSNGHPTAFESVSSVLSSPSYSTCHSRFIVSRMQASKAAEIPEELFEDILEYACGGSISKPDREAKGHISTFAMVCRYWARMCRRELFRDITLRTPDDANRFREILSTPALPGLEAVSELVWNLHAAPDNRDEPWLHLLFLLVIPGLWDARFLSVKPLPSGGKPWRNIHPSLPRSLPGSIMPVWELHLEGVHFASGRVLSRLISSIPLLQHVDAFNLTFDTKPKPEDFITPPFSRKMYSATSDDLQLCLSFIPLLVANTSIGQSEAQSHRGRSPKGILNEDDLKTLWELFSIHDAAPRTGISYAWNGEFHRI